MPGRRRFDGDLSDTEERNLSELLDPIAVEDYFADDDPLLPSLFDVRKPPDDDVDDPDYEGPAYEQLEDNPGFSIVLDLDGPTMTLDDLM